MKYSELQLKVIRKKKPELIKKNDPTLNDAIVEFLKKYKMAIDLASFKEINIQPRLSGGMIKIKRKKAQEEFTKLRQWALDHKDFPKFQTEFFNKVYEHNKNIDKNFENPEYQNSVLNPLIQAHENRDKLIKRLILIFLGLVIIGNIYIYWEERNDNISLIKNISKKNFF